ncbi:MAG: hypothetical protein ACYSYM_01910, partial [Planctomycetota bacterium]
TLVSQRLEFDPVAMKVINNAEADALLRPEHRQGWSLSASHGRPPQKETRCSEHPTGRQLG